MKVEDYIVDYVKLQSLHEDLVDFAIFSTNTAMVFDNIIPFKVLLVIS